MVAMSNDMDDILPRAIHWDIVAFRDTPEVSIGYGKVCALNPLGGK